MKKSINGALLYGILDTGYVDPKNMMAVAEDLLAGDAGALQLRAKGYSQQKVLELCREYLPGIVPLCEDAGVPFIINDFPGVAHKVGAHGVHIGQDDGDLQEVRKRVGPEMIVGRSTHSLSQARAALEEGFNYIGFGPLFPTPTKEGRASIGLNEVGIVEREVGAKIPVFCIGGIKPGNIGRVLSFGARRVVVVSALLQAENVAAATREIVGLLR